MQMMRHREEAALVLGGLSESTPGAVRIRILKVAGLDTLKASCVPSAESCIVLRVPRN